MMQQVVAEGIARLGAIVLRADLPGIEEFEAARCLGAMHFDRDEMAEGVRPGQVLRHVQHDDAMMADRFCDTLHEARSAGDLPPPEFAIRHARSSSPSASA